MSLKITTIVDNIAGEDFVSEHGYSLLIEMDGRRILFDSGQGEALFNNADKLGIELKNLDYFILSHGHYDHGGNVRRIIEMNPQIKVVAHPKCLTDRWSIYQGKPPRYNGLSQDNKKALADLNNEQMIWIRSYTRIINDLWVTGEVPRETSFEDVGGSFYLDEDGINSDRIEDDISIFMNINGKLLIICGCCHSGIVNTVEYIKKISGIDDIELLMGGFHLKTASVKRMNKTISYLNSQRIEKVISAHCTGENSLKQFMEKLTFEVISSKVGLNVYFEQES